jgi:hypothetical protein
VYFGLGSPWRDGWQEDFYRDLHRHPELSHQEQRTRRWPSGYDVHDGVGGGTGVVGVLGNGDGLRVLLPADMDALPVREATGLPYASTSRQRTWTGAELPVMHRLRSRRALAWSAPRSSQFMRGIEQRIDLRCSNALPPQGGVDVSQQVLPSDRILRGLGTQPDHR